MSSPSSRRVGTRPGGAALAAAAGLAVVVAGAPAAAAAVRAVAVVPTAGPPLTVIRVSGTGYCSTGCSAVSIAINSVYVASGVAVSGSGRFAVRVRVPGSTRPGPAQVLATQTDRTGASRGASTTFTVTTNQPASTTLPPPRSSQPPGGLPPAQATTAATSRPPPAHHHRGSHPPRHHRSSGSHAPSTSRHSPSPRQRSTTGSASRPAATSPRPSAVANSTSDSTPLVWWIVVAVALVGGTAVSAWAVRRRRH